MECLIKFQKSINFLIIDKTEGNIDKDFLDGSVKICRLLQRLLILLAGVCFFTKSHEQIDPIHS